MALSQVYTAVTGHIITAARWNNEFGNIYANGVDLAFPVTKAVSLAGWTLTLDSAGASTLASTSLQGLILTPGSKSGTPGLNGNSFTVVSNTFTDSNTAAAGTAAFWCATAFREPTLASTNGSVTTTDAATVYIEAPIAGTNETFTNSWALYLNGGLFTTGVVRLRTEDNRTNTVTRPLTVQATTTNTPAAGIGTGIAFRAESQDENPSDVGYIHFAYTDVNTGTEDSYFSLLTRVAGALPAETYRFSSTTAQIAAFTHANTATRTYTFPNLSGTLGLRGGISGPTSTNGTGSAQDHEGNVTIAVNQALDGIHYYTNFTLDAGVTITPALGSRRLVIIASESITINGTIAGNGRGNAGGSGGGAGAPGNHGTNGTDQGGGGGGADNGGGGTDVGGNGGTYYLYFAQAAGGQSASGNGSSATAITGTAVNFDPFMMYGGSGGGEGGSAGGDGGYGGCSVVLIAPNITLGAAAIINTSGANGVGGTGASGAGGGGGAGNIYIACNTLVDSGCTFTQTGGTGGASGGAGGDGGNGGAGALQVNIYG